MSSDSESDPLFWFPAKECTRLLDAILADVRQEVWQNPFGVAMSNLSAVEKRTLEEFLQMGGGYVLDFSNRALQEFVFDSTGLDIANDEVGGSGSKANRLRYFWNNQPDHIVGKVLKDLVEYVETNSPLREKCRIIANRLSTRRRVTAPTDQTRIWGDKGYRVFLSHKAEVKKAAAQLKERLELFGISAFVAHADIQPTKEWQEEIENALASMNGFVALLTKDFHRSYWTDQEVGYAVGRGVPLIAVKLGRDPYGFIGKFQGLSCTWSEAPAELVKLLIKQSRMLDAFIDAVPECGSFDHGNTLSQILPCIEVLTETQAERLASAFNTNSQLQGSFGFNGAKEWQFGPGLAFHLSRATGKEYLRTESKSFPNTLQIKLKRR